VCQSWSPSCQHGRHNRRRLTDMKLRVDASIKARAAQPQKS
jgi:hypothetical protein